MTKQSTGYCSHCKKQVLITSDSANHILHLLLTIITSGFWSIIWLAAALSSDWRCSQCGKSVEKGSKEPDDEENKHKNNKWYWIVVIFLLALSGYIMNITHTSSKHVPTTRYNNANNQENNNPRVTRIVTLKNLRVGENGANFRLLFDVTGNFDYNVRVLDKSSRLEIDVHNCIVEKYEGRNNIFSKIYISKISPKTTRIIMDMRMPVKVLKSFVLPPSSNSEGHFVVDIKTITNDIKNTTQIVNDAITQDEIGNMINQFENDERAQNFSDRLAKLKIKRIYSHKRTGEPTDFLLYTGGKRDKKELEKIVSELKKISSIFYLYDDINILDLNWLMWGAAFEGEKYYTNIAKLENKCKCAMSKHYISADFLLTSDGLAKYQENKQCSPCNISKEIEKLKEFLERKR